MSDTTAAGGKTAANEAIIEHLRELIPPGSTVYWIMRSRQETQAASLFVLDPIVLDVRQNGRDATAMVRHVGMQVAALFSMPWDKTESGIRIEAASSLQVVTWLTEALDSVLHGEPAAPRLKWKWL